MLEFCIHEDNIIFNRFAHSLLYGTNHIRLFHKIAVAETV